MALRRYYKRGTFVIGLLVVAVAAAGAYMVIRAHQSSIGDDASGLPRGPISGVYLQGRSDAHLTYPGAKMFKSIINPDGPTRHTIDGDVWDPADLETFEVTNADPLTVRNWFRNVLASENWTCSPGSGPDYTYNMDTYYRGPREEFWVG